MVRRTPTQPAVRRFSSARPALMPFSSRYFFTKTVRAEAEVVSVSENGKMIDFIVRAWDDAGPIGEGKHTRAIIHNERFLAKCGAKLEK